MPEDRQAGGRRPQPQRAAAGLAHRSPSAGERLPAPSLHGHGQPSCALRVQPCLEAATCEQRADVQLLDEGAQVRRQRVKRNFSPFPSTWVGGNDAILAETTPDFIHWGRRVDGLRGLADWQQWQIDLSELEGQQSSGRFRFRLVTDSVGAFDGVYLDDFQVYCQPVRDTYTGVPNEFGELAEMAGVLAQAGVPESARDAIDVTLAALDQRFPGARGRLHRSWLLASRACLTFGMGEAAGACADLRGAWDEAGGEAGHLLRAHWPAIRPVLWHALTEGGLTAEEVLPAMSDAFPGGEALVAMVDHPEPAVRRTALVAALAAGHPELLPRLDALAGDPDPQVAAAAAATRERLRTSPPPLHYELLGGFRVSRAGWQLDDGVWQRPMAARLVRFLLLRGESGVPEDEIFEAFWFDRPTDAARRHLAVALSRARKVLDLPHAEQSVIEIRERTYRLRLRERDTLDAQRFEASARAALGDPGSGRLGALEGAAALWTGEPLPEDRYSEWAASWRERIVLTYTHLLAALIDAYEDFARHDDVIRTASRLLELDPHDERAHRRLMAAYARSGRMGRAHNERIGAG